MISTVGLIGCGRIGKTSKGETLPLGWRPYNHIDAIEVNKNLCLTAVCDVSIEKLKNVVAKTPAAVYCRYEELIDDVHRPDILGIATRTKGRTDIIRYAAEHGVKGIYIEKPISTSLEDCYTALDAVEKNNVNIVYGTQRRFHDVYMRARDLIRDREIGDIVEIQATFGRAPLLWTHPHTVDTILYFAESCDVEYVQASCSLAPSYLVSDSCADTDPLLNFGFIQFKNGITANISCQNTINGMNITISGTTGTLSIPANGSYLELDSCLIDVPIKMSGTQRAYAELARAVETDSPSPISTEEVRTGHEILFGFVRSSMYEGRRTRLSELDERFVITGRQGDLYP